MAEEQSEKGTKQHPFTREDVLSQIKENGGTTQGLDLSGMWFEEGVDLSRLDMSGVNLKNAKLFRANVNGSNLNHAILVNTNLGYATFNPLATQAATLEGTDFRRARLHNAQFRNADLTATYWGDKSASECASIENVDFRGANLFIADFTNCYFYGTKLEGALIRGTNLSGAHLEQAD